MTTLTGTITERLSVRPEDFFDLISSVRRLPEWNEHIHHVVQAPNHEPRAGDEWVVEIRAMWSRWNSRSQLQDVDRSGLRFALVSQTDDGNPSYALWTWQITLTNDASMVTVRWELHPKTFWRKMLISRIRHRQLKDEVRTSLRAAEQTLLAGAPSARSDVGTKNIDSQD